MEGDKGEMIQTRRKGQRTFSKAMKYANTFPDVFVMPIYQVSRWAQPQPCDMIVFRTGHMTRLVEVRSNQYGLSKQSTRQLSQIPGDFYIKQVWMFKDGEKEPFIRQWDGEDWSYVDEVFGKE